jgi:hypothetical protein
VILKELLENDILVEFQVMILYIIQCKQLPNLPAYQIPTEDYIYINCDPVLPRRKLKTPCTNPRSVNQHQQRHPHQLLH